MERMDSRFKSRCVCLRVGDGECGFTVHIKVCILKVGDGEGGFKDQIKVCIIKVGDGEDGFNV